MSMKLSAIIAESTLLKIISIGECDDILRTVPNSRFYTLKPAITHTP